MINLFSILFCIIVYSKYDAAKLESIFWSIAKWVTNHGLDLSVWNSLSKH